jgi:hypothetical protein
VHFINMCALNSDFFSQANMHLGRWAVRTFPQMEPSNVTYTEFHQNPSEGSGRSYLRPLDSSRLTTDEKPPSD